MFGTNFSIYFSVSNRFNWKPYSDLVWGKSTHFYHPDTDKDTDWTKEGPGVPLNKQWSLDVQWLWFYFCINLNKDSDNANR